MHGCCFCGCRCWSSPLSAFDVAVAVALAAAIAVALAAAIAVTVAAAFVVPVIADAVAASCFCVFSLVLVWRCCYS